MRSRVFGWMCLVLLTFAVLKPVVPVWAGAGLIAFVVLRAGRDLSSPYARERWAAFKRLAAMGLFGFVLIGLGTCADVSLPSQIACSADARQALGSLAVCFSALFGVPAVVFLHVTRSRAVVRRRGRVSANARTLSRLAAEGGRRMSRAAV